jgi:predicted nucleotidyltransferase
MPAVVDQIDRASLGDICRRYKVRNLKLFGSMARNEARPESDIDILVEYERDAHVTFFDMENLADALRQLFGEDRYVDLVTERSLHPLIRKHVRHDEVEIYTSRVGSASADGIGLQMGARSCVR